jgi:DNA-binding NarL/FixJ family response regulator
MSGVRLMIVDDDPGIRQALRMLANAFGAEVLAEADNGRAAIEQAEICRPEMMLLDVSMPVMGGFSTAKYLRDHIPELQIILVSQYNQKLYAEEALEIGVRGYIVKSAAARPAIHAVLHGGTFVSPSIREAGELK